MFVITAKAENALRVLQKISSLITRKRLKVQEMKVSAAKAAEHSHLYLLMHCDETAMGWLMKQLGKCIDLFDLQVQGVQPLIFPWEEIASKWLKNYQTVE